LSRKGVNDLAQNEEKKYPCIFGIKDDCGARKFVEESEATKTEPSAEEKAVLEKAMKATKGIQFDDKVVAKELGEALAEGAMGKMLGPMLQGMKPSKAYVMRDYCNMCPDLFKERTKNMPVAQFPPFRVPPKSEEERKSVE